jgi:Uma2 family endonuclease
MRYAIVDPPEIEFVAGKPYPKVRPKRTHGQVQGALFAVLRGLGRGLGKTATEWRFDLAIGTELVPDVAFVFDDRLRPLSDEEREEPPFAPDIAGEVRSPSHRRGYARRKIDWYFAHGTSVVIDVDPAKRVVFLHERAGKLKTFRAGERVTSTVFDWLAFDVDELFEDLEI